MQCRSACVLFLHAFGQHSGLAVRVFTGSTLPGSSQAASACRAPHFVCCSQLLASACLYVVCLFACSLLQQGGMHVQRYRAVIGSWSGPQLLASRRVLITAFLAGWIWTGSFYLPWHIGSALQAELASEGIVKDNHRSNGRPIHDLTSRCRSNEQKCRFSQVR